MGKANCLLTSWLRLALAAQDLQRHIRWYVSQQLNELGRAAGRAYNTIGRDAFLGMRRDHSGRLHELFHRGSFSSLPGRSGSEHGPRTARLVRKASTLNGLGSAFVATGNP